MKFRRYLCRRAVRLLPHYCAEIGCFIEYGSHAKLNIKETCQGQYRHYCSPLLSVYLTCMTKWPWYHLSAYLMLMTGLPMKLSSALHYITMPITPPMLCAQAWNRNIKGESGDIWLAIWNYIIIGIWAYIAITIMAWGHYLLPFR